MQKIRSLFTAALLTMAALLLLSGCQVGMPGDASYPILKGEEASRSGSYAEYKEVTTYETKTIELPKDMVNYVIDSMKNGGYSKDYNDGTYKGRVTSVDGRIISSTPSANFSHVLIYKIRVTYKGTVKREHNLPTSKEVTVYETVNTIIPPSMLDTLLHSLSSGTTKNYNDGEYKGQLKSVDAGVVNQVIVPNLPGEYRYYIKVTYKGTVYVIE